MERFFYTLACNVQFISKFKWLFKKSLQSKHSPKKEHFCGDFIDNEMKPGGFFVYEDIANISVKNIL